MHIKGLDSLNAKLKKVPGVMEDAVFDATFEIVEDIQGRIESKLNSSIKYNRGGLVGSFKNEVVKEISGDIVGRNWSDDPVSVEMPHLPVMAW